MFSFSPPNCLHSWPAIPTPSHCVRASLFSLHCSLPLSPLFICACNLLFLHICTADHGQLLDAAAEGGLEQLEKEAPVELTTLLAALHWALTDPTRPPYFSLYGSVSTEPAKPARMVGNKACIQSASSSSSGNVAAVSESFYADSHIKLFLPQPQA